MGKKLKAVLSFALALVLVLSLGVSAFADGASTEKEKEPEIVQIAFNLGTMEPCAVRMRELGYDDIRLDGVSYKADAEDGVIAIQLGDLAAAKLLRENTDKAKELGIDYANLYIRGGRVLVKDDTGLSSDEISALKQAVASLMSSVRVAVNIGDIFDLANGEKVKLRVQVCNFIYPTAQKESVMPVKAVDLKTANEWDKAGKAETPTITTVYIYYESYFDGAVGEESSLADASLERIGFVGIAKDANDKNDYSIKICFTDDEKSDDWEDAGDIAQKDALKGEKFDTNMKYIVEDSTKLAKKILISKDKGKTTFRTITLVNETPKEEELSAFQGSINWNDWTDGQPSINEKGKEWLVKNGYDVHIYNDRNGHYCCVFTPKNSVTVIGETDNPSKVILKDKIIIPTDEPAPQAMEEPGEPVALISTTPSNPVVTDAPEHEHTWSEWETTKPATCTEAGEEARRCTADGCGATETRAIPAAGHAFADDVCTACGAAAPVEEPKSEETPAPVEETKGEETPAPVVKPAAPTTEPTPDPAPTPEAPTTEPTPAPTAEPTPAPIEE